jgi:TldD protein
MDKKEILEWKQFLRKIVDILEEKAVYADALLLHSHELRILKDKTSIDVNQDSDKGIKIRAFDGEKFWEYATSDWDKERLLEEANLLKSKIVRTDKIKLAIDTKKLDKDFCTKAKKPFETVALNKKVKFINELQEKLLQADRSIVNARALYEDATEFKIFVNRYKQLSQKIDGCLALAVPYVQTDAGEIRYHYESFFKPGYEVTDISDAKIKKLVNFALKIKDAKKIKPGKYLCYLTPHLSGLLAHESFGHGMESDTVFKDRAKASEYIGKKIAAANVSIVDNPAYAARNGTYFFDDEGVLAGPTYLVKKGIVQDPITEMYSASRMGIRRSANARLESFDHKSYARMSNTYFMPGKDDPAKMLRSIKDGLYLHNSSGGMEDPKGWGVQIQGVVAERIKDGRLTGELFYEIGMTGYLPTILSNILKVGDRLEVPGTGRCGKGHKEWVRVSEGGSHLLIKDLDLS